MVQAKKDLRIYLSKHETEQFKLMCINLGQTETIMAHNPDLVPLDVFLDFSGLVSQSFQMYGESIGNQKSVSWDKMNILFQRIVSYCVDFHRIFQDREDLILFELIEVRKFVDKVREGLTLADIVNK